MIEATYLTGDKVPPRGREVMKALVLTALVSFGCAGTAASASQCITKATRSLPTLTAMMIAEEIKIVKRLTLPPGFPPEIFYYGIIPKLKEQYPTLTEEQVFEAASFIGNASGLNTKYYLMLYHNPELAERGGVVVPNFDVHDTSGNICDPAS
jgi:hypothetical protein